MTEDANRSGWSSAKTIAVIVGLVAVAGVLLNAVDQALARKQARSGATRDTLAVAATGFASGSALGGQFRCTEQLTLEQLQYYKTYRERSVALTGGTELDAAMARATQVATNAANQLVGLLDRRLHPSLKLDESGADAASTADCTVQGVQKEQAQAAQLLRQQNAAAARASDLGRARGRIPQALALFGVAGAVFAFAQQAESRRGRRASAAAGLVVVALGVTLGVLAVTAL